MQSIKSFPIVASEGIYCDLFYHAGIYHADVIQYNRVICTYTSESKQSAIKQAIEAFNFSGELV